MTKQAKQGWITRAISNVTSRSLVLDNKSMLRPSKLLTEHAADSSWSFPTAALLGRKRSQSNYPDLEEELSEAQMFSSKLPRTVYAEIPSSECCCHLLSSLEVVPPLPEAKSTALFSQERCSEESDVRLSFWNVADLQICQRWPP